MKRKAPTSSPHELAASHRPKASAFQARELTHVDAQSAPQEVEEGYLGVGGRGKVFWMDESRDPDLLHEVLESNDQTLSYLAALFQPFSVDCAGRRPASTCGNRHRRSRYTHAHADGLQGRARAGVLVSHILWRIWSRGGWPSGFHWRPCGIAFGWLTRADCEVLSRECVGRCAHFDETSLRLRREGLPAPSAIEHWGGQTLLGRLAPRSRCLYTRECRWLRLSSESMPGAHSVAAASPLFSFLFAAKGSRIWLPQRRWYLESWCACGHDSHPSPTLVRPIPASIESGE